jgi:hypothetical protein
MSIVDLYIEVKDINENGDVVTVLMPKPCDRCKTVKPNVRMRLHPVPPDGEMVRSPLCSDCQRVLCGYAVPPDSDPVRVGGR